MTCNKKSRTSQLSGSVYHQESESLHLSLLPSLACFFQAVSYHSHKVAAAVPGITCEVIYLPEEDPFFLVHLFSKGKESSPGNGQQTSPVSVARTELKASPNQSLPKEMGSRENLETKLWLLVEK